MTLIVTAPVLPHMRTSRPTHWCRRAVTRRSSYAARHPEYGALLDG